ncbi:hypothetical protein [Marinicella sediminis]|nr:hypothetical protein [Marinicella sediminis]
MSEQKKPNNRLILGSAATIIIVLIIVIVMLYQNNQALKKQQTDQFNSTSVQPAIAEKKSTGNVVILEKNTKKPDIKNTLKDRKKGTLEMSSEETGMRMFQELKTVTQDQEQLNEIMNRLLEEAELQSDLERSLSNGDITTDEFWDEVEQMRMETDDFAYDLLEIKQYDRFREVRQSWSKGRIHPDRDSRE